MVILTLTFDEPAFPDLERKTFLHTTSEIKVAVLDRGMGSGKPSVAIRINLAESVAVGENDSSEIVLAETSARLFCLAANMIMAKYPGLLDEH